MAYQVITECIKGITPFDTLVLETEDIREAYRAADEQWSHLTDRERENRKVYILDNEDYMQYQSYELFDHVERHSRQCAVQIGSGTYIPIRSAYPTPDYCGIVYVAEAIKRGDPIDCDGDVPTYTLTWDIENPEAEDEDQLCDWLNPVSVDGCDCISADAIR